MIKRVLESRIERKHRQTARRAGWFVEKIMLTAMGGFPDRFYAKDGRVVLMEWKRPGGKVTPQQRLRHEQLQRAGVEVHVVRSLDEANRILQLDDGDGGAEDPDSDPL